MDKVTKILILEDRTEDAELEEQTLKEAGINFVAKVVSNKVDFERELLAFAPDLLIVDFELPQYSGMQAIFYMEDKGLQIPVIMISGTLPQDVDAIVEKVGASKLLLKDEIAKLPDAVKTVLTNEMKM